MKCSSSSSRAGVFLSLQASENDDNKMSWRKKKTIFRSKEAISDCEKTISPAILWFSYPETVLFQLPKAILCRKLKKKEETSFSKFLDLLCRIYRPDRIFVQCTRLLLLVSKKVWHFRGNIDLIKQCSALVTLAFWLLTRNRTSINQLSTLCKKDLSCEL